MIDELAYIERAADVPHQHPDETDAEFIERVKDRFGIAAQADTLADDSEAEHA